MKPTTIAPSRLEAPALAIGRELLLVCGAVSSLLYVATDILAATRWSGYGYASQTISELMGIGAPTRPLMVLLFSVYSMLVIAFGMGVWGSAGEKRSLRFTGMLLVGYGVVGFVGLLFFPIHLRGAEASITDTMHMVLTSVIVLFTVLAIGFGGAALGKWFRLYSILTIVTVLAFGALTGLNGPRIAANLPTPWVGITERICVYSSLLWMLVLAVALWRAPARPR
jgi:hypothetical protein